MIQPPLASTKENIIYLYDGTLDGLLCCIYRSIKGRTDPCAIQPLDDYQPSLFACEEIITDEAQARTVGESIVNGISAEAMDLVSTCFLSCLDEKEDAILRFLRLGYANGKSTMELIHHPDVAVLLAAQRHLLRERHLLLGFVRFSEYDGKLISVITPKNQVLPFLASHFVSRFNTEEFLIYDKTHLSALVYQQGRACIIPMEDLVLPEVEQEEIFYQQLWKKFYHTIGIQQRYNPKCRMTHLPKRYWCNMVEMQDLL